VTGGLHPAVTLAKEKESCVSKKKPAARAELVLFNVLYEDDTLTSNRKVPSAALGGLEGDAAAFAIIGAQDAEIAERSGRPRPRIKSIGRVGQRSTIFAGPDGTADGARKVRQ